jgi:hypothetical protein
MALVSLGASVRIPMLPGIGISAFGVTEFAQTAMDAAGESTSFIGHLQWEDGASHTVSSAGGKIHWMATVVGAFANAGSTVRVGLQDVDTTTGLEDGTFDVHDDLVGGTDPINANAINEATMSSGSKTIAHGGLVAVVIEMTARGGVDSVSPGRVTDQNAGLPYCATDTGAGSVKQTTSIPYCVVQADDGALGIFGPLEMTIPNEPSDTSFNSGSAVDEYAIVFQLPFKCEIDKLCAVIGELDAGETGELVLYSAPTTSPVAERTITIDPDVFSSAGSNPVLSVWDTTAFTLEPNTDYAVACKATSAGNRTIRRVVVPSANFRKFSPFGTTLLGGQRANEAGAFSTFSTHWAMLGFMISKLDDGASAGGGLLRHPGMNGGLNG